MVGFGSRYGKRIKELNEKILAKSRSRYKCPSCSRTAIRREAAGIWKCRKCGAKFASDSYEFSE
ncbi:MAG: hypothetical protein HZB66_01455 [Candidatus Aenigmarchaeota archaeon]|nr:hypothetical protein [Candidatus Aenigmarchaeota archaeon]